MPGSDQKINYQVRPAKSIERKMLCDLIREVQLMRADGEMRYIGLGAKYFTDFLLLHNEFGITDMISIESEKDEKHILEEYFENELVKKFEDMLENNEEFYFDTEELENIIIHYFNICYCFYYFFHIINSLSFYL